ncbi:hypothetical protein EYR36_005865 [Pleurotus pulmonarius]|nr:hypothetical protein EYR36_005865 [Pleurotus pulmonarius]
MPMEDTQTIVHSLSLVRQGSAYDYLLTVGDERFLVWTTPWSLGKVLFFLTRYPAFVDVGMAVYHNIAPSIRTATCELLYTVSGWMVVFGMIIAELIMVVRVWALWANSKIIGAILVVFSIVAIVVSIVYFVTFTGTLTFIATDTIAPGLIGCLPGPGTNVVFIDFVALTAYEASLLILLLLKGVQHRIVYYVVLLLVSVLNVAFLFTGSPENTNLLTTLQRTFHSILSARMLLQLRKSALKRHFFSEASVVVDSAFISSGALLVYDYILTVSDEGYLVWNAPWSLGKVLFLLTRYPAFIDVAVSIYHAVAPSIRPETCELAYNVSGWMIIIGMIIAELIMVIRVWALWGNSKIIGVILVILSIIGIVIAVISYIRFSHALKFIAMDAISPGLKGCLPGNGTNIVFIDYLTLMAYEALVMILLLLKGFYHFHYITSRFMYTFYQDGIVYYAVLLLVCILNVAFLLSGPVSTGVFQSFGHLTKYTLYPNFLERERQPSHNSPEDISFNTHRPYASPTP